MFDFATSFLRDGLEIPEGELNPFSRNFKLRKAAMFWFLVGGTILAGAEFVAMYKMIVIREGIEKQLALCLTDNIDLRFKAPEPLKAPPPTVNTSENIPGIRPPERPIRPYSKFAN